jgi:hypothetical protein
VQQALYHLSLPVVSQDPETGCCKLSLGKIEVPPPLPAHGQCCLQFLLNLQDSTESHRTIHLLWMWKQM